MRSAGFDNGSRIGRSAPAHNPRTRGRDVDGVLERRYLTGVRAQPRRTQRRPDVRAVRPGPPPAS
jgi:hypothetical protein